MNDVRVRRVQPRTSRKRAPGVFGRLTLNAQIVITIVLFALFPTIFLGLFYYGKVNELLHERLLLSANDMMSQADDTIEAMLKQVEVVRTQVILKAISSEALLSRPIYASPQLDAAALEMRIPAKPQAFVSVPLQHLHYWQQWCRVLLRRDV